MESEPETTPRVFVFMGVSGCGKSTIGSAFARATGGTFLDGDDFHPPGNVAKMSGGIPLDDDDRDGWIAAIAQAIRTSDANPLCIACSALRKKHRDALRAADATLTFIYLDGARQLLEQRLADRRGHFMPAGLLDSQLADLEAPAEAVRIDISAAPDTIIAELKQKFGL